MDIFKRISISLQRFYLSIVSCFRGKFISRRVLPVLLCLSLFSVPAYASDYNSSNLDISEGKVTMSNAANNSSMQVTDYTSTMVIEDYTFNGTLYNRIYNTDENYYKGGFTKNVVTSNNFKVNKSHTYTVSFKTMMDKAISYTVNCYIYVFDGNGNRINTIDLYTASIGKSSPYEHSFDFNLSNANLPSGYSLQFGITQTVSSSYGSSWKWSITDISYTDNDDNTGLLNTIISAIGVVWNSIKDTASDIRTGFSNLGSTISNKFSELGTKISNSFDNLNQWLISVKNSIVGKLTEVKDGINNKLQELKDKLAQQIAQIKEDIRSLFIPSDGYFNDKRGELDTFFNEHFGALYQGPTILVNLIKKLVTISPQEPGITLPAIEFMWQGKKVSLTEPIHYSFSWVNDAAHPLHFAYTFYRGFITVVMFVAFVTYLKNKYSYIFER